MKLPIWLACFPTNNCVHTCFTLTRNAAGSQDCNASLSSLWCYTPAHVVVATALEVTRVVYLNYEETGDEDLLAGFSSGRSRAVCHLAGLDEVAAGLKKQSHLPPLPWSSAGLPTSLICPRPHRGWGNFSGASHHPD